MAQVFVSKDMTVESQTTSPGKAGLGYRALRAAMQVAFRVVFRVRVEGIEHVTGKPVVICANHLGWTDVLMVLLFLPARPRIYVVGDKGVQSVSRFLHFLVNQFDVINLDRAKPVEALRTMRSVVEHGGSLLVFPEGRLGTEEGKLMPLQKGAVHIAVQAGVDLLPVGLTGNSKLWVRRHLTMRVGTPVSPTTTDAVSLHEKLEVLTGELRGALQRLLPGDTDAPKLRLLEKWLTRLF